LGRLQFHSCAPRFRKTDGDGLLGGLRTMLALPNVMYFLADKLAGLRARRLPFPGILLGAI
jgi:hypothetical protein